MNKTSPVSPVCLYIKLGVIFCKNRKSNESKFAAILKTDFCA